MSLLILSMIGWHVWRAELMLSAFVCQTQCRFTQFPPGEYVTRMIGTFSPFFKASMYSYLLFRSSGSIFVSWSKTGVSEPAYVISSQRDCRVEGTVCHCCRHCTEREFSIERTCSCEWWLVNVRCFLTQRISLYSVNSLLEFPPLA